MRETPLGSPLYSRFSRGVRANGELLLGGTPCCGHYELFKEEMIKIFDRSVFGCEASRLLTTLHQGRRSVADFAIEFRTLATMCEWNEPALVARFLEGLNMDLKEETYARGPPAQLDQLIELGIRLDRCFEQRRRVRVSDSRPLETLTPAVVSSPLCSDPEPMQLGGGVASLLRNDNGGF